MSKSKACALPVAPSWFSRSFASSHAVMQEQFLRHIMTGTTLASVSKGKLRVISQNKVWTISAACSSASLVGSNGRVGCQLWKQNGIDCLKSGFQQKCDCQYQKSIFGCYTLDSWVVSLHHIFQTHQTTEHWASTSTRVSNIVGSAILRPRFLQAFESRSSLLAWTTM